MMDPNETDSLEPEKPPADAQPAPTARTAQEIEEEEELLLLLAIL